MSADSHAPLPLPTLPTDLELLGPGELAEMIAAQRGVLEKLRPCSGPVCPERTAHERTLHLLMDALKQRVPAAAAKAHTPLEAAQNTADVLRFEVPASHRKQLGQVVTTAKNVFVQGLKPFHVEALRPQHAFNQEMLAVLEHLHGMRATSAQMDMSEWVRKRLSPLVDPTAWRVEGHRKPGLGSAVRAAKRSYLSALGPVLRPLLAGQQRWNAAAVELLAASVTPGGASPEESARKVADLLALADPLAASDLPSGVRAASPLWREVLRRQVAFNQEVTLCLADLLGTRTPATAPSPEEYAEWYQAREPALFARAAEALKHVKNRPLISLVTPVYETPEPILRACIDSVLAQSYENWEMCLADDGSKQPQVAALLEEYSRKDARIRVTRLEANGGIARATNAAISLARGEFVAFMDHDDTLAPHALAEMVLRLEREPQLDMVYSDEDRFDNSGRRFNPFFKPDWSPDLLRAVNYICHFVVIRRTVLEAVGGLRPGYEGSQDYEFLLRVSEKTQRIGHVAGILYHWRASDISLSMDGRKLVAASAAGVRALGEHLARLGEEGEALEASLTQYRVRYPVKGEPLVSIIVPFKDKPELLRTLTTSLLGKTRYQNYELLLVSNNSTQRETFELLESLTDPRIRKLTWDFPFNYPAINNHAAREARGELLLFLNNDMEVIQPEWLEELIGHAQRPEVGAVGAKLLFPDGSIQHAGVVVGVSGFAAHPFWRMPDTSPWTAFGSPEWTRNYLAVTSACVMLRRELFESLNGYDERFVVCGSDVDLGLRIVERGRRVVYTPHSKLVHHESASRRLDSIPESDHWLSFAAYRRWLRDGDPYYNANLTLTGTDCSLRRHAESGEALALQTLARDLPSMRDTAAFARAGKQQHLADHVRAFDCTSAQVRESRAQAPARLAALRSKGKLEHVTWFLPAFHHPTAGIHTLLRFADLLRARHGTHSELVIYDNPNVTAAELEARTSVLFAEPPGRFRVLSRLEDVAQLPATDLAVASMWNSAYAVLAHPRATARAYFVQDFETAFFPAGTQMALAEQTYRLGLYGIFNTRGLHDFVTSQYPMEGTWFEPAVDRDVFHARRPRKEGPLRVFFYGRPSSDRNAFELGIAVLRQLKAELGAAVEIVSAGERWNPEQYGLQGVVQNLGVLPYEKTADLYRRTDVGLCFMFTKHPSYLPFELMACGVTVVTNDNPANHWLLEHERNCLLAEPTYSCVLEQLRRALVDTGLRGRLATAAAERVTRTTWEEQVDRVHAQLMGLAASASKAG
ncbi:glycosyltransferase [Myxococcaceae bacterium GXIMD 01537]